MDLWIRAQDKSLLIKCNSVGVDYNSIQVNFEDGVGFLIGEYPTKERALEVLDEIEKHLRNLHSIRLGTDYLTLDEFNVYNMPKE